MVCSQLGHGRKGSLIQLGEAAGNIGIIPFGGAVKAPLETLVGADLRLLLIAPSHGLEPLAGGIGKKGKGTRHPLLPASHQLCQPLASLISWQGDKLPAVFQIKEQGARAGTDTAQGQMLDPAGEQILAPELAGLVDHQTPAPQGQPPLQHSLGQGNGHLLGGDLLLPPGQDLLGQPRHLLVTLLQQQLAEGAMGQKPAEAQPLMAAGGGFPCQMLLQQLLFDEITIQAIQAEGLALLQPRLQRLEPHLEATVEEIGRRVAEKSEQLGQLQLLTPLLGQRQRLALEIGRARTGRECR